MPAMALEDDFTAAVARVNNLPRAPGTDKQLELYGLYKQATAGDAGSKRPGRLDIRGRAKHDAWATRRGMSAEDAMRAYIALADQLAAG
jgi:acyl-CoA-binding protein